jgi:hypothetical protein
MNKRLALWVTRNVGTMSAAYVFAIIGAVAIVGTAVGWVVGQVAGAVSSFFIQLVMLPLLMVGQNLLGAKSEQRSAETHDAVMGEIGTLKDLMRDLHRLLAYEGLPEDSS